MQFKNPEVLYALFLLLIPILVHLFQLRRFEKTAFTNVKFLQNVILQTRKSSQLKKWLILGTRLLAIAGLVFAFAQPYFANRDIVKTDKETVIYLDNSFSMQSKGEKGALLKRAVQELLNTVPEEEEISLFTNTETFKNTTIKSIRNELLQLDYSHEQEAIPSVLLKGRKLFSKQANSVKNLILISDFQQNEPLQTQTDSTFTTNYVQVKPANANNIALDSLYIAEQDANTVKIAVVLKNSGVPVQDVPVSLYDGETLIAKSSVNLDAQKSSEVSFSIPSNKIIQGNIRIDDTSLQFDNNLFFNINKPEKINVLAINEADDEFLQKLYTEDEFNLTSSPLNQLNYNEIATQQLIVLNELKTIPNPLLTALRSFKQNGGSLVIIPAKESNLASYNELLQATNFSALQEVVDITEKKITNINFSHPLFTNVFEKEVTNFQYPKVNHYFSLASTAAILRFENNLPFLVANNEIYVFTAAVNRENSNFQSSPLIVPIFYNIAKNSLRLTNLYYTLGRENVVDVQTSLTQDAVLTISNLEEEFIPLQQTSNNKVRLTTDEFPTKAGIYSIKNQNTELQQISYNFSRNESDLQYHNLANLYPENTHTSVAQFFEELKNEQSVASLWKWFVIFALVFLGIEMLILKFVK
ncbi:putative membrane protein (TIGR02226 family) [Kordia periserrulae]|uniref:Putative membrane protein (TIGR02226 family) n=1 Tax=Kordia periserrulae TaxID=701523 RepID=A0A2T6C3Q7_9FLAO|nr:BatA domain-containing protein [Kordia periserrulae]PTX62959.1 putative membrane protein (TIGR02226 family) [Kordia periserrulae]